MVEFRGWWIVLDALSWIFILIVFGMAAFGAWPPSPYDVILLVALVLACIWSLLAWRRVRAGRRPPDAGTS
jgi:high-affinity K+ transport system ATPase subunit B